MQNFGLPVDFSLAQIHARKSVLISHHYEECNSPRIQPMLTLHILAGALLIISVYFTSVPGRSDCGCWMV